MSEVIGSRIKALRSSRKYTLEHMAEQIGISKQRYVLLENGDSCISLEIIAKIAAILDVTIRDITGAAGETSENIRPDKAEETSFHRIMTMMDLFYANKHMYRRLHG